MSHNDDEERKRMIHNETVKAHAAFINGILLTTFAVLILGVAVRLAISEERTWGDILTGIAFAGIGLLAVSAIHLRMVRRAFATLR